MNYDQIKLQVKDDRTAIATSTTTTVKEQQHHPNAISSPSPPSSSTAAAAVAVASSVTNSSTWQTMQPARIQSMVVQNDGTIILCDNDPDIVRTRPSRIEVVEILSPPNYIRGKFPFIRNCCLFLLSLVFFPASSLLLVQISFFIPFFFRFSI